MSERIYIRYQPTLYFACSEAVVSMLKNIYPLQVYSATLGAREIVLYNCPISSRLFIEFLNLFCNPFCTRGIKPNHECNLTCLIPYIRMINNHPLSDIVVAVNFLGIDDQIKQIINSIEKI